MVGRRRWKGPVKKHSTLVIEILYILIGYEEVIDCFGTTRPTVVGNAGIGFASGRIEERETLEWVGAFACLAVAKAVGDGGIHGVSAGDD